MGARTSAENNNWIGGGQHDWFYYRLHRAWRRIVCGAHIISSWVCPEKCSGDIFVYLRFFFADWIFNSFQSGAGKLEFVFAWRYRCRNRRSAWLAIHGSQDEKRNIETTFCNCTIFNWDATYYQTPVEQIANLSYSQRKGTKT